MLMRRKIKIFPKGPNCISWVNCLRRDDEADATILALSAARALRGGVIAVIEHLAEGRFALALDGDRANRVWNTNV